MSMGGAIAGGSRLAIARDFDPTTFWAEVRRYGITVASYTWTMLHEIANAPDDPAEHHHPVRLFIGAGMPRGLWRRVARRFAPATVLEFYASTEGDAILVNLSGEKPGCKGRPLPGSAEIRLAAYDVGAGRLREGLDGFAMECRPGEVGMLLTRLRGVVSTSESPLRGLFEPDDAWLATGDLFRADEDGALWLIDHVQALIRTEHGYVASFPILDALGDVDAIDLGAVYAVPTEGSGRSQAVAAVTLREGRTLDSRTVTRALSILAPADRPDIVHVVDEIPVTTWYRPNTAVLRAAGAPRPGKGVWRLEGDRYVEHRRRTKAAAAA
jgi:putative long chain acyl-CoA synthase